MINDKLKRKDLEHKKFNSYNLWQYIFTAKPVSIIGRILPRMTYIINYKKFYLW